VSLAVEHGGPEAPAGPPQPEAARRVLVVAPQPFYADRGTPIAVRQVLEALSRLGYRADVLTYPLGRPLTIARVELIRARNPWGIASVPIGFSLRKVLLDLSLIGPLRRLIRSRRYSCVHAVEEAAFPAVFFGRRYGVPVIYDMQSSLPEQLAKRFPFRSRPARAVLARCERWLIRHADFVVGSAGLGDRVRRIHPAARVREWRFPSAALTGGVEEGAALRRALGIAAGARVVLYSGTFEPYQGLQELVQAVPRVLERVPDAVFVLVGAEGSNGLGPAVRPLVERGVLRILDRRPREEIPRYLAMADVLVSPRSYGGNVPLKVFDYLAAGRPIVATDIPPHRTVLGDDRAVLVAPDPASIAGAIVSVLTDPARAGRLAEAARRYAGERLGWEEFVASVGEIYQEVIDGARAARIPA